MLIINESELHQRGIKDVQRLEREEDKEEVLEYCTKERLLTSNFVN